MQRLRSRCGGVGVVAVLIAASLQHGVHRLALNKPGSPGLRFSVSLLLRGWLAGLGRMPIPVDRASCPVAYGASMGRCLALGHVP